jgi:DNA-directed RNA polymerase I, II, and III subunit RPABC2
MSDLELSDNEVTEQLSDEEDSGPTFTIKPSAKKEDNKLKEYDEEGNVITDYGEENEEDEEDEEEEEEDEDEDEDLPEDDEEINYDDEDMEYTEVKVPKKKITKKNQSKGISEMPDTQIEIPNVFDKEDEDYIKETRENYLLNEHPESLIHNYDEIYNLAKVQRNKENIIVDELHKTIPILTKYEKTKILGLRAKQLNNGAIPYVKLNVNVIDGYLIAIKELEQKKIPFIIRRPLPSGASEYWHLQDLEII